MCTFADIFKKVKSVCPTQVYMYAAWNGWTVPVFLFLALLRLSLNYLIARSFFSPPPDCSQPGALALNSVR